jgi:hypothetical protein
MFVAAVVEDVAEAAVLSLAGGKIVRSSSIDSAPSSACSLLTVPCAAAFHSRTMPAFVALPLSSATACGEGPDAA